MNTFTIKLNKPIGYGNGTNQSKKKKSEAMGNLSSKAQEDTNVKSKTAIDASSKIVAEQESQVPDESSQQVECESKPDVVFKHTIPKFVRSKEAQEELDKMSTFPSTYELLVDVENNELFLRFKA